jgi:AcrR family transcriptional regulator
MSTAEPSLRQRKKEETRQVIADTAMRLFAERGFDTVTVAEVARAANLSEGTVFNYFPTKEDLFYGQMEVFEASLVEAVRERAPGESVVAAFRGFVLAGTVRLAAEEVADVISTAARIVNASPALQAREREIVDEYTRSLAELVAQETGAGPEDVEPWAVANALMGVQRGLVARVRGQVLDGRRGAELAADARSQGKRAFARLERGLSDYAVKRQRRGGATR